jgi:alpha-2-macroglobulin
MNASKFLKQTFFVSTLAIAIATLIILHACGNSGKKITTINPGFYKYVSAYTSGIVSKKSKIKIQLTEIYKDKNNSDKIPLFGDPVPDGLFELDPAVKGKAAWTDAQTIEFTPEQALTNGQLYDVEFHLGKLISVPGEFKDFRFQFATVQQNLNVEVREIRTLDSYNIEFMQAEIKVYTSDYVDSAAMTKFITAKLGEKEMKVRWTNPYYYDEDRTSNQVFYYSIDSIPRKKQEQKLSVNWNGAVIGYDHTETIERTIPALGDFSVMNTEVNNGGEQNIRLEFSEPIHPRQNLNGIITIKGIENLKYSVDGNQVYVYLPNRYVGNYEMKVNTGIKNFKGYKMINAFASAINLSEAHPKVRLVGKGNILPNSSGLTFPFEAIMLKAVDVRIMKIYENNVQQFLQVNSLDGNQEMYRVAKKLIERKILLDKEKKLNLKEWNRFSIDLAKYISPEPGAIYRVDIKFNKDYSLCDCEEGTSPEQNEGTASSDDDPSWSEGGWYDSYDDGYYQNRYAYEEDSESNGDPCDYYFYHGRAVGRNILASDVGIIAKMGEERTMNVAVSNMVTTQPLVNAAVEFYDFQKQLIASGSTDAKGIANVSLRKKPYLLIAKSGNQRGYLKLQDGLVNSLSKFDVGGEENKKGIKGCIYTERGVWRPGDSIYVSFILEDKLKALPAGHPVKFELLDPNYQVVQTLMRTRNVDGVYDFRTATSPEAVTGNWQARVSLGNNSYAKDLKIETVKPNRLKIYMEFPHEQISVNEKDSLANLKVKWLHGAVAKNLSAQVDVSVSQMETRFPKYSGFIFDSPLKNFNSDNITLFAGKVNEKGEAKINTQIKIGEAAPGMLKLNFSTKVWEEGGDFSVDRFSTKYSPFTSYVGIKIPEGSAYDKTLETGKNHFFEIASLDGNGKALSKNKLNVKVYLLTQRWWYDEYESAANYLTRSSTVVVLDTLVSTKDGKGGFNFRVGQHEYGKYLVLVNDAQSLHSTGTIFWMDQPYWARENRLGNENASMLNFTIDKEKYTVGENVKLTFPSPGNGKALVSVETGRKILKQFWVDTKKGETRFEFPSTQDMSPNAYLHVTLLQPHADTKNDLPIRLYGVVNVEVDDPETHLHPAIKMADVIKPESVAEINVSEDQGKEMTYTLAVVDEGLLDLTRFQTPQPHTTFYTKEALGVKTWDIYDMVLGAQAGKIDKMLSIGGDESGSMKKSAKASRFKPMVKFIGPFHLPAGGNKTHHIDIPNYVGSVRVMVVASHEGAYGNVEKTVSVHKPLMVLATLPRVLGPLESVYLPVNIFAMEKHVKNVKVEIETNDLLSIDGVKNQSLVFTNPGDEVVNFKLNVAEKIGVAKVKVTVTSGKEKAYQEIELQVRTPNPKVVDAYETVLKPGQSWSHEIAFKGIEGTNKGTIELSVLPQMSLESRMQYLIQYPHGCIEQTTSSVFPQMLAANIVDLSDKQKKEISGNVKAGLKRLQLFQTFNGGFSYWPGEGVDSEWGTNYAGNFMLEAEKLGYTIPSNMKSRWVSYQQSQAKNWINNTGNFGHPHGTESNQSIQAYRLYTLALAGSPELGSMNRLREEKDLFEATKWRLAAAYHLVGQPEIAKQLMKGLKTEVAKYKELSYSYGSDVRDEAMILEALVITKDWDAAAKMTKRVAENLNSKEWMSTQETGYSLLAMCKYADGNGGSKNISFDYAVNGEAAVAKKSRHKIYQVRLSDEDINKKGNVLVKNNGDVVLYAKLMVEGVPSIGDKSAAASNLSMDVRYTDMKGNTIDPVKLTQGSDFIAEVTVKNPGTRGNYKEMALNQVFPSGWEIHNVRMDEAYAVYAADKATYQDIRDDRVFTYFNIGSRETKKYKIVLNATYLGRYYLPTVYSEAMYDNTINARVPGKWVEVVKDAGGVATK